MVYNIAAIGGTFDRLHKGHAAFLRFAFSHAKRVVIGLTTDKYIKKAKKDYAGIEPYDIRYNNLIKFLKEKNFLSRSKIIPIDTVFGPMLDFNFPADALIVTKDTEKGAALINKYRQQKGLTMLPILYSPQIKNIRGEIICSTYIRQGNIFLPKEILSQTFTLPIDLRARLRRPFGKILAGSRKDFADLNPQTTIAVGDITTKMGNFYDFNQQFSVIDFTVERKKIFSSYKELGFTGKEKKYFAANPPSQITSSLLRVINSLFIKHSFKKRTILFIYGEEDLAVIPLILAVPLGFVILYGQPKKGLVKITVTEKIKSKARSLFNKFRALN